MFETAVLRASEITGIDRWSILKVLPSWHACEPTDRDDALSRIRSFASILNLKLADLMSTEQSQARPPAQIRCKGANSEDMTLHFGVQWIAIALARQLVFQIDEEDFRRVTAQQLRDQILANSQTVDLESLLKATWSLGVPVAHLRRIANHRPHGMAIGIDTRSAIVLARNQPSHAFDLFDLAHELGHIMSGHISPNDIWSDDKIEVDDGEEREANQFAFELLTGLTEVPLLGESQSAKHLARKAVAFGKENAIDPGLLISAYGKAHGNHRLSGAALREIHDGVRSSKVIEQVMLDELEAREVSTLRLDIIKRLAIEES